MKELNDLVELAERADSICLLMQNVNPHHILAIAEALRALEQENILLKQGCENNPLVHEMIDWKERAEAAEANLAEFAKQELIYQIEDADGWQDYSKDDFENFKAAGNIPDCYFRKLFTAPAPAASLAELVPDAKPDLPNNHSDLEWRGMCDGWNACRAAILRNIEEQSQ